MTEKPELLEAVITGMQEKKAHEILCIDLREIEGASADYFVICHGDSHPQVDAISDSVVETVWESIGEKPWRSEGKTNLEWVLIDFFDVVVHVFYKETREFFDLEGLWADGKVESIEYQV